MWHETRRGPPDTAWQEGIRSCSGHLREGFGCSGLNLFSQSPTTPGCLCRTAVHPAAVSRWRLVGEERSQEPCQGHVPAAALRSEEQQPPSPQPPQPRIGPAPGRLLLFPKPLA